MERSKPLHNFSLPPSLTWGKQRFLRCMNQSPIRAMSAIDDAESSDSGDDDNNRFSARRIQSEEPQGKRSSDDPQRSSFRRLRLSPSPAAKVVPFRKAIAGEKDEISTARERLMLDYQTAVGKMKDSILYNNNNSKEDRSQMKVFPLPDEPEANFTPPNLKTKHKIACNAPTPNETSVEGGGGGKKSGRLLRNGEKKVERAKFSISLSRREIEDDFIAMTGKKPPRKPNKRPKTVQNQLDAVFPGLWLTEVTADLYEVNEKGKS